MAQSPVRICLIGSRGRMGREIAAVAESDPDLAIVAEVDYDDSIANGMKECDVAIDFSSANAIESICRAAAANHRALVIGTTGHTATQKDCIKAAAASLPIVFASNFSVGVNTLFWLTGKAAELLGEKFQPEIVETHHVMKKDAPSGTAKTLADLIKSRRAGGDVSIRSIREGEVVGEHIVTFSGAGERLELAHRAESRATFASGALAAAKWVVNKPAGLYSMQNVLGLTS